MTSLDPTLLGFLLVALGLGALGLARLTADRLARQGPQKRPARPARALEGPEGEEGVVITQSGGRIAYLNRRARRLFDLNGDPPDLETLARRIRPSDLFLELCAQEGEARLALGERAVEAHSHRLPLPSGQGMFIILRELSALRDDAPRTASSVGPALETAATLGAQLASAEGLEEAARAVLETVTRLLPADLVELNLWDEIAGVLRPYRLGTPQSTAFEADTRGEVYHPGEGFTGWLVEHRQPLLLTDVSTFQEVEPKAGRERFPFRAYLGVPLVYGDHLLGTLEAVSLEPGLFDHSHRLLMELVAVQAAAALHQARQSEAQRRQARELAGLSELAAAVEVLHDRAALLERLTASMARLLDVEILGFLLYDEVSQHLVGQVPFAGIPDPFVDRYYQVPAGPGSPGKALLEETDAWLSNAAEQDPEIDRLGFRALANAASIRNTLFVPLIHEGRRMGVVQAANTRDGRPFTQEDIALLQRLANQAAALLEHAATIEAARRRAERAEGLRRVTALAASAATLDELLRHALRDLARLLRADLAAALLVDEQAHRLRPHQASLVGLTAERAAEALTLALDDPEFRLTVAHSQRATLTNRAAAERRLPPTLRALVAHFDVESVIAVPLVVQNQGAGELLLARTHGEGFSASDLDLASAFAGQLAGAFERARLLAQTDASLRGRVERLDTLLRLAREIGATLDLDHLARRLYEAARRATEATCGFVLLLDSQGTGALAQAGDALAPPVDPLTKACLESGQVQQAASFEAETDAPHPGIGSALVVPISLRGRVRGAIGLHRAETGAFDETALEMIQGLATQAAIALANAEAYTRHLHRAEWLRRRAEALSQLLSISTAVREETDLKEVLETIAYGLQAASGFNAVAISLFRQRTQELERVVVAGLPRPRAEEFLAIRQPWEPVQALLQDRFRLGHTYFIPYDERPQDVSGLHLQTTRLSAPPPEPDAWYPEDLLLVPLWASDGSPLGLISLDDPRTRKRPDQETVETIEVFAHQAALAVEQHRLRAQSQEEIEGLTRQLQDLRLAYDELRHTTQRLVRQEEAARQEIEQHRERARMVEALARAVERATAQTEEREMLRAFARGLQQDLDLSLAIVAEPTLGGMTILGTFGQVPAETNLEALLGQNNPVRVAAARQAPVLVREVTGDPQWADSPLLKALQAHSALAMPVLADDRLVAVLLFAQTDDRPPLPTGVEDLFETFLGQLQSAMEHLRLLRSVEQRLAEGNLLLEFSRELGSLDLERVMHSLADGLRRAMPAVEACLVALWDAEAGALAPYGFSGYPAGEAITEMRLLPGEALAGKVYASGEALLLPEVAFARDYNLRVDNLQRYHQATEGRVPVSALGVPLTAGEAVLGVLVLENYTTPEAFGEGDITFARSLARQAALTVQNARLYRAAEQRARQLEALANISATLTSSLDSQQIVQSLLEEFARVLPYDSATLWLRENDRLRVVAARGFGDDEERIGLTARVEDSALYEAMVRERRPILVADTATDPRFPSFPDYPVRSWLGIPLIARDEVIGLLSLDRHEVNAYRAQHLELATTLARQAAVALENAQLYEQARQTSEELERRVAERTQDLAREHERVEALLRITTELSVSLDLDRVLQRALALVNDFVGADRGVILLVAPDSDQLILRASLGSEEPLPPGGKPSPFRLGEGLAGWVIANREAVVIPDLTRDERWVPHSDRLEEHKSAIAVPLTVSEDALGAMLLLSHQRNAFDEDQLRLVAAAANQVAAAINNAELYRLIRDQAERLGAMLRAQQVEASKSRAILESIADGVLVTDAAHRIVLLNPAAGRILGLEPKEVLNRPAVEYIGVYGAAGRRWAEAVQEWSQRPPSEGRGESLLVERLNLEDGRIVSVHVAPVLLDEEFLGTVSIFRDITREVEVDRLKSEFVATVSHELRTPMTSIKGYVEVLLMGAAGPITDEQRRFLNIVKANTDRLGVLVNDLLDISRIEAGKVDLSLQPLDVRELLEEAHQYVRRRSQEEAKPMEVVIQVEEALPLIQADPERLRQIIINLVDNGYNYTPAGGRVELRARRQGEELVVEVTDNGIGIPPTDHERVFERFYRGEQALVMGVAGTGLGLSIVKQLVEMHGGRIWVQSEGVPGKGSTFGFALPLTVREPAISTAQDGRP